MMNITPIVKQLLIINILFFVGTLVVGEPAYQILAMFFPENQGFHFWQPLSHMFMHGNFMHIFFNMFALYSFGSTLEHFWGEKKFLFFYISCGLGAVLVQTGVSYYYFNDAVSILESNGFQRTEILQLLNQGKINTQWQSLLTATEYQNFISSFATTMVGASGAVYGLLIAFAFMFPNAELGIMFIPVPVKAKYFVPVYMLLFDGFFGIFGNSLMGIDSGIAHFAHIGGAITGFLIMWYWKKNQFNDRRWN
ncbi:Membrane associated serine protease, rhomboid family [Flavobacterium flevense]|uniref:Rhomboid family intramembrane serine protease n=1 Tax=Flavobacterium flevense TaxID=983 RepID=A0A4Y4AXT4_9FLAO|nr:rhomboid family intramembrane serine protease [Flavobacterium flevense]GEC71727.1 rhomboid family intramembrane serine protease [Flavobacterium flevense]SHL26288.1 Membrane associated serine protease, rhomboid family [Flavobacterium flevense]